MMDRPIKFRGMTEDKKWVYGDLFYFVGKSYIAKLKDVKTDKCYHSFVDFLNSNLIVEVIPETVGQFTGFKDNRENCLDSLREWYDDDILCSLDKSRKGVIKYDLASATYYVLRNNMWYCSLGAAHQDGWYKIGNTHDHEHPELIENVSSTT